LKVFDIIKTIVVYFTKACALCKKYITGNTKLHDVADHNIQQWNCKSTPGMQVLKRNWLPQNIICGSTF